MHQNRFKKTYKTNKSNRFAYEKNIKKTLENTIQNEHTRSELEKKKQNPQTHAISKKASKNQYQTHENKKRNYQ